MTEGIEMRKGGDEMLMDETLTPGCPVSDFIKFQLGNLNSVMYQCP